MQPFIPKTFAALVAYISALILHAPGSLRDAAFVSLGFFILDTITGVITAIICREASSHTMRTKLISKSVQYSSLIGLAIGASVLTHTWTFIMAAFWSISSIDGMSILENIMRLQTHGGVNMGPASGLLQQLSQFFKSTQAKPPTDPAAVPIDPTPKDA